MPSRHCGRGKCKEGRAERVDRLAHPGAARSRCAVAADAARCSVPAASAVRRSPTSPRSCCAAGRTRRRPGARHGFFERPAGGAFCSTAMHNLPVHPVMVVGDVGSHRLAMGLSRFNVEVIALAVSLGQPHHLGRKAWRAKWEAISCACCDHASGSKTCQVHWPWVASAFRAIG